jgi:hypothetical protein
MRPERKRTRGRPGKAIWLLAIGALCAGARPARDEEVGSAIYVRTDSDHTTVVSPRVRGKGEVAPGTSAEIAYGADVWTSASIDIRTAASKVVTEQRDELDFNLSHELTDVTLGAGYRFSKENDYESHAGNASFSYNFADNAATLAASAYVSGDKVGRSGDPKFDRGLTSVGSRLGFTQVVDAKTVVQLSYDLAYLNGYQASPYRFVGIGGDGRCHGTAPMCLPESDPKVRLRHALVGRLRRAFGESFSVGLSYRFYLDDWGIRSHTIEGQLALLASDVSQVALRYRFYTQSGASFYRARYLPTDDLRNVTIDRKMSPMGINRVGLDYERGFALGGGVMLRGVLSAGLDFYKYDDFPGLTQVTALEISAGAVLQL